MRRSLLFRRPSMDMRLVFGAPMKIAAVIFGVLDRITMPWFVALMVVSAVLDYFN